MKIAYTQVPTGERHSELRLDARKQADRRGIFCEKMTRALSAQPPESSMAFPPRPNGPKSSLEKNHGMIRT
jgi:hypothetical protein